MPIKFISIIDETGNEILSAPRTRGIRLVGGVISAVSEISKSLDMSELERLSTGSETIYINRLNPKLSIVILVDSSEKRSIYEEYVRWLIDTVKREINQKFRGGDLFFVDDSIALLRPLLDNALEAHRNVEDILIRLGRLHRTAKEIIGVKADKIVENCQGESFKLVIYNGDFYISESSVGFDELIVNLKKCISLIKGVLKELL